jgi:hypothetical protein
MYSPGSAVTVELPRWALADGLTLGLLVAAGAVLEVVLGGLAGAPPGAGALTAAALALWQRSQRMRRPVAVALARNGGTLTLGDGRRVPCQVGPRTRVLGPTVLLHWQSEGPSGALWLTPADLPRETVRRWAVELVTGRFLAAS